MHNVAHILAHIPYGERGMRTTVDLDNTIVTEAMEATGIATKRGVIQLALEELVKRRKQRSLVDLRGAFTSVPSRQELAESREISRCG